MRTSVLLLLMIIAAAVAAQEAPTTREMNLLGWQEFSELVPGRIETSPDSCRNARSAWGLAKWLRQHCARGNGTESRR